MTESLLCEKIGRLQLAFDDLSHGYDMLLSLLAGVIKGEIDPCCVLVNLTNRSWQKTDPDTRPSMPATINGKPECVIAPDPQTKILYEKDGSEVMVQGRNLLFVKVVGPNDHGPFGAPLAEINVHKTQPE